MTMSSPPPLLLLLQLLTIFAWRINALDILHGTFVSPPAAGATGDFSQNPTYQIGQQINIEWTVSWRNVNLWLWQNDNPNPEPLFQNQADQGHLQWQVKTNKNYTSQSASNGTVFYFQIVQQEGTHSDFKSHYFNLTGPGISDSATASASASTATSTSEGSSAAALDSDTNKPAATAQSGSGTSYVGLAAGLGVGLGLAAAGIVAATVFFVLRRRRRANNPEGMHVKGVMPGYGPTAGPTGSYYASKPAAIEQQQQQQSELKPALNLEPVEIMGGRRNTHEFFNGATRVHEMPLPPAEQDVIHEMPANEEEEHRVVMEASKEAAST